MAGKKCRSCGAEIEWARFASGKAVQLDLGEFENGNLTVIGGVARPRRDDDHGPRRRAHFASCPQADMWRKRR